MARSQMPAKQRAPCRWRTRSQRRDPSPLRKRSFRSCATSTVGERDAAEAAAARLKAKLEEACRIDKAEEMKFSFPDLWSIRLFIALCRRYGLRPYRYRRQRNTTVMVKAPRRFFDAVVWQQFNEAHADLWRYFEETTERLIRETISTHAEMV